MRRQRAKQRSMQSIEKRQIQNKRNRLRMQEKIQHQSKQETIEENNKKKIE